MKKSGRARKNPKDDAGKKHDLAVAQVLILLESNFTNVFESHIPTMLRAATWLAATSLFRSFGFGGNLTPGSVILSDKANEEGAQLLTHYLFFVTEGKMVQLDPERIIFDLMPEEQPKLDLQTIQATFQDAYNSIMKKYAFGYVEGARLGALACALMTQKYCADTKELDARVAAGIVATGFIEGTKTFPVPLEA